MKTECTAECLEANGKRYACTVSLAMDLIGGKWKAVVLYHLQDGAKRFGELHARLFATLLYCCAVNCTVAAKKGFCAM